MSGKVINVKMDNKEMKHSVKFSIQSNPAILDGQGSQKLFEIVALKMTNIKWLGQHVQEKMTCVGDNMEFS